MISCEDVLTTCGRHDERLSWVSDEVRNNAKVTAAKVSSLLTLFGRSRILTSGFRDLDSNKEAKGAAYSQHMYGRAADIEDSDRKLSGFITEEILEKCGLWAESTSSTPSWVHVQTVPPPSNKRIFTP